MSAAVQPEIILAPDVREFLNKQANRIKFFGRETVRSIGQIGEVLSETKSRLKRSQSNPGTWSKWLAEEFEWSDRTAEHYIDVYEWAKLNPKRVSDSDISLKTLYLLARKSTPEPVRQEAVAMLQQGAKVDVPAVRNLITIHAPKSNPPKKRRRSHEEVEREKDLERRRLNLICIGSDLRSIVGSGGDPKQLAADLEVDLVRHSFTVEFLENLPHALGILISLKDALQSKGLIKPTKFGMGAPVIIKHRAGGMK